jgi:hypothetical protein
MSRKDVVDLLIQLHNYVTEDIRGNVRISYTTDLTEILMPKLLMYDLQSLISPCKITTSVQPYGNYEKHIWNTNVSYIKYQELIYPILEEYNRWKQSATYHVLYNK